MKLTKKEFTNLRMINNKVLLRAIQSTDHVYIGDTKIMIRSGSSDNSAIVIHEVVKTPQKIIQLPPRMGDSIEWETQMELVEGDKVWINRTVAQTCEKVFSEGEEYLVMPYQHIYLTLRKWNPIDDLCEIIINPDAIPDDLNIRAVMDLFNETGSLIHLKTRKPAITIRNTRHREVSLPNNVYRDEKNAGKYIQTTFFKVIMLNGFVLFQNIPVKGKRSIELLKPEYYDWIGRVAYTGSLNKGYKYHKWPDANYIRPGDIIHLKHKHRIPLEYSIYATFLDRKPYYITQRNRILGKIQFRDI